MFDNKILAVNIFDLSGDNDYKQVRKDYIQDAIGVLFVFDVNIKSTFNNISVWEKEAESNGLILSKCSVLLIGNKIDIKNRREVSVKEAKEYAKSKGYNYFETSAKTSVGINETFQYLFDSMYSKVVDSRSRYLY